MEALAWSMLVAAPFLVSAAIGRLLPKTWQKIAFSGLGAAAIHAMAACWLQRDMTARFSEAGALQAAGSLRVALEAAIATFPIGLCVGLILHLSTRFIRTKLA